MAVLVEACTESLAGSRAAEAGGAGRLELCANLEAGGTTPSTELVAAVAAEIRLPLHVLIRPRSGEFVYDRRELAGMVREIARAKGQGAAGVVIGTLDRRGALDGEALRRLRDAARPLTLTFHRAFDQSPDPFRALELLIEFGIDRLLSSGQAANAEQGIPLLARLVQEAGPAIVIMAGGGIRSHNALRIVEQTGVPEIHSSGGPEGIRRLVNSLAR